MKSSRGAYPEISPEVRDTAVALLREHGETAWLVASQSSDEAILAGDVDGQRFWDAVLSVVNALDVGNADTTLPH